MEFLFPTGGILDFRRWKSRLFGLLFYDKIDGVEVHPSLASSCDFDERTTLKLLDETVNARDAHSNLLRKPLLAGKAKVVVPRITEEQGVDRFCADRNRRVPQNEVRDLSEPVKSHRIGGVELHVALNARKLIADVLHHCIIPPQFA